MKDNLSATRLSERVYWVGAADPSLRDLHGYSTPRGTTYGAFLVVADEVTLIDTVKPGYFGEMLARIKSVVEPSRISRIISNHSEMDHSGSLPEAVAAFKPKEVLASAMGEKNLKEHFSLSCPIRVVKDGERLDLGGADVSFIDTRMLHWPDSMFTFLHGENVLFSSDAFGMHLAGDKFFADEYDEALIKYEAGKYFANILLNYSHLVGKLLEKMKALNLPLAAIYPDHGPLWGKDFGRVIGWYADWAEQRPSRKAILVYDTMWNSTELMAKAIAEGVLSSGAEAKLLPLKQFHRSDVATELLGAGALVIGSPTLNNGIFPTLADTLCYLKGLKPKNLIGASFGSYGWGGEAVKILDTMLTEMNVKLVGEGLRERYVPDAAALDKCREFGNLIAAALPR